MIIEGMRATLADADNLAVLATVEGSRGFDQVLAAIKTSRASVIWLQPFMVVAGDHARNDLAGDESDSWASPPAPYSPVWASCPACAPSSCAMPATARTIC